ncbi:hypothetical protein Bca52824_024947 [Brassica carinata]|uniref:Secreted protein n=1 Tax=Brassica carinata TaxID=52824 RepID=A0A8X8AV79_BRACI|nr:hypothetical protein Bca52824_024947 [Brassica carinata]
MLILSSILTMLFVWSGVEVVSSLCDLASRCGSQSDFRSGKATSCCRRVHSFDGGCVVTALTLSVRIMNLARLLFLPMEVLASSVPLLMGNASLHRCCPGETQTGNVYCLRSKASVLRANGVFWLFYW